MQRKPIPLPALCAIVRVVIERDPSVDNFTWMEDSKRELLRQGWNYPRPEDLASALQRVERALSKRWGPRPPPRP